MHPCNRFLIFTVKLLQWLHTCAWTAIWKGRYIQYLPVTLQCVLSKQTMVNAYAFNTLCLLNGVSNYILQLYLEWKWIYYSSSVAVLPCLKYNCWWLLQKSPIPRLTHFSTHIVCLIMYPITWAISWVKVDVLLELCCCCARFEGQLLMVGAEEPYKAQTWTVAQVSQFITSSIVFDT